jgi:hypothetical protein
MEKTQETTTAKTAEERGMQMMRIPMSQLPEVATDYAQHLCRQVGMCMEVLLTAWTVYAQIVEGLPCTNDLYFPNVDAINFYKEKGYTYKGPENTLNS